jgi:glycosyltransferase involved in cell wall biosynthesis
MNLLFYAPSMAAYGGIERHVCGLAAAAAAQGHSVRLLTTGDSLGPDLRRELAHPLITFRELQRPRGAAGPLRKILWLLNELRLARATPWDVLYTNGQSGLARLVWSAARPDTRIVHHHHTAADPAEQLTWSALYRRVLRRAPHLVGCSRATCNALDAATNRADAVFLPYLAACPVSAGQIIPRPPARPLRFGFCGRLIPEKGIATLLALSREDDLADIQWHIHGAGPAYPESHFTDNPRLVYHGAYHGAAEHARALLSLDALTLFSTHNEGMPLSLIEGMSAGLPWIATDRGGTRELATSPQDCVVIPADASRFELLAKVRALADRIHSGVTSRPRQRTHYDTRFAPPRGKRPLAELFCHREHRTPTRRTQSPGPDPLFVLTQ